MSLDHINDALPHVDTELDEPGMRDAVDALILAEMDAMAREGIVDATTYLSRAPPLPACAAAPGSALIAAELARIKAGGGPSPPLPSPARVAAPPAGSAAARDPAAWDAALAAAGTALEAQALRGVNLELQCLYGGRAWAAAADDAEKLAAGARRALASARARAEGVNAARAAAEGAEGVSHRLRVLTKRRREGEFSGVRLAAGVADAEDRAAGAVRGAGQPGGEGGDGGGGERGMEEEVGRGGGGARRGDEGSVIGVT